MGLVAALLAGAVGLGGAYLAAEFVAPWVGIAFLAIVALGTGFYVNRYGHRQFRGGGNTDLGLFIAIFGIIVALAVPRYTRAEACDALNAYAGWLEEAQNTYFDQFGRFAAAERELSQLSLPSEAPASGEIVISVEEISGGTFQVTLRHPSCPDTVSVEIQRENGGPR